MEDGCGDFTCSPPSCEFPAPVPKTIAQAGVKCGVFPHETCRVSYDLPQQPQFALDCKEPLTIDWPPNQPLPQDEVDTGPRPDLLALIPDQIVPQVVTLKADVQQLNNSFCPDAQFHMNIEPKQKKPLEIRMPKVPCPIRGPPPREWIQCVENALVTDAVRRPLARYCHKRPMPPLVIPTAKYEELKAKCTERERKQADIQKRLEEKECQRLRARERQGKWNYTVESLLDRKREKERAKEEAEKESTRQLMEEIAQEKRAQSDEQNARAKKMILYSKGLIRDFHSALGYSKMMQEIEQAKTQSVGQDDSSFPFWLQKCTMKMMYPNETRADYQLQPKKEKEINQKLLQKLKLIESRAKEHEKEINSELCSMKQMIVENAPEMPESYKKHIAEPVCDKNKPMQDRLKYRCELYSSISEKLAADAFIESHENEIDRQADEFNEYKKQIDAIRKAKEKQLIDEKVAYHIRKSEAAARALVQLQQKKKGRANEYDALKDQWESEFADKLQEQKSSRDRVMDKVVTDFNRRKCVEGLKKSELDPARLWCKERLVTEEKFERECEEQSERRKQAEDVALFNKAQASAKNCRETRKKYMDNVWGQKMKAEYLNEMKEMKTYAQDCIQDWKDKGRNVFPMQHAMKKWEYDSGMYPYLFEDGGSVNRNENQCVAKSAKNANRPAYEITSKRLGFGSGGC